MTFFRAVLLLTTLLCSLTAGLLLTFAIVVMPGIGRLDDRNFLRAFQVIDRVIQNNQPVFMLVWVGSVLALLTVAVLGVWQLRSGNRVLIIIAALVYFLGVQLPTAQVNVPLNNKLQTLDPSAMSARAQKNARDNFERRWNRWNVVRTVCSILTSTLLLFLLNRV
ncbi:MAG TPA: DUF1772 domain-containing protein [Bryobacteraceae bacterium]